MMKRPMVMREPHRPPKPRMLLSGIRGEDAVLDVMIMIIEYYGNDGTSNL